jgi:SecY
MVNAGESHKARIGARGLLTAAIALLSLAILFGGKPRHWLREWMPPTQDKVAAIFTPVNFEMAHVIHESDYSKALYDAAKLPISVDGVEVGSVVDQWRPDRSGVHNDYYLTLKGARDAREAGAALATFLDTHREIPEPPPKSRLVMEQLERDADGNKPKATLWRTYLLSTRPEDGLTREDIATATVTNDPITNRPMVQVQFTRSGADRFGTLTERIAGDKLAVLLNDVVKSAPIINEAIRSGTAMISMGGSNPAALEREAIDLATTLRGDTYLPDVYRGDSTAALAILALLALGLAAITWFVSARFAKHAEIKSAAFGMPRKHAAFGSPQMIALALTVALPVGLWWLARSGYMSIPGTATLANVMDLEHATGQARAQTSIFALGILPFIAGFQLVEFVAWVVPALRKARTGFAAHRRRIDTAAFALGTVFALIQSYFLARYLNNLMDSMEQPLVSVPLVMISVAAGASLFAFAARVITVRGLASGWLVFFVVDRIVALHSQMQIAVTPVDKVAFYLLFAGAALLGLAITRATVAGDRAPRVGIIAMQAAFMVSTFLSILALSGAAPIVDALHWVQRAPGWTVLFTCPLIVAAFLHTRRAPYVEALLFVGIVGAELFLREDLPMGTIAAAMIAGVVLHDVIASIVGRSRLQQPTLLLELHDPDQAFALAKSLRKSEINVAIDNGNARSLLRGLGSFAPIALWVSAADVAAASSVVQQSSGPSAEVFA